jgi:hypothetical protein
VSIENKGLAYCISERLDLLSDSRVEFLNSKFILIKLIKPGGVMINHIIEPKICAPTRIEVKQTCDIGDMYRGRLADFLADANILYIRLVFISIAEYRSEKANPIPVRFIAHVSVLGFTTNTNVIR